MRVQAYSAVGALFVAAIVAACSKPGTAVRSSPVPAGAIIHRDSLAYFDVDGGNASDVNRSIALRGPHNSAGWGAAMHQGSYSYSDRYTQQGEVCTVGLTIHALSTITLPRWRMASQSNGATQKAWMNYVLQLTAHEKLHRGLFQAGLDSMYQAATAEVAPDCASLRPKVRSAITAAMAHNHEEQLLFDAVDAVERRSWLPPP